MRVLVIGGSGRVGSMTLPQLAAEHTLTVLDRRPPRADVPGVGYLAGDLADYPTLLRAAAGQDALLFMAMGPGDHAEWGSPDNAAQHLDVAVKGLYLALRAAAESGVRHAVFASSMSVYGNGPGAFDGPLPTEDVRPDAADHYGLAKRLGEEVARAQHREFGIDVVALRLCFPMPDEEWPPGPETPSFLRIMATSARDTARALLAGLAHRPDGFAAFAISGDDTGRLIDTGKAAEVLGWRALDGTGGLSGG